ncbi:MAG TPA: hypothetical protein PLO67_17350 [Saprospiraceae bacterium]|nr:hypothetical protein [Saprospiraceae bacterium]HPI08868.1 hypothetical protein [Saprospiraceae bacterium]
MGADLQQPQFQPPEPKKKSLLPFIIGGVAILIVCALEWSDVIEYIDGEPKLTAKHQNQLQKKLDDLEAGEQYCLVAMSDGWYPCLHSGRALYYLHTGEVWKYGITTKGERGRYTSRFLQDNGVLYVIQFKGTVTECLQEEQRKLFAYPLLPENLARLELDRLLRPPYNPVLK